MHLSAVAADERDVFADYTNSIASTCRGADDEELASIADLVIKTSDVSKKVIVVGNGGSAGIASHVALDRTKADAEKRVLELNPAALVIRTNFYGWGPTYRQSFTQTIVQSLRSGQRVTLFSDVLFTPILIELLAGAVEELLARRATGVFNVGGDERISKHDFGVLVAQEFGLDASLLDAGMLADRAELVQRPRDMSLSNRKLTDALGRKISGNRAQVARLREQELTGVAEEIRSLMMIPYGRHHIDEDDIAAVEKVLRSGALTQGPVVPRFEDAVREVVGARYAVAVSSCTAGLHLASMAAGAGPGKSIVTTPVTFVASANAALYVGATPAFADIEPSTVNLSAESLAHTLDGLPSVSAVIPVHFAGLPCDMPAIRAAADAAGAVVIEDAAHAFGATYEDGSRVGSCGHSLMTVFSFHPVKAIAAGEGGMITTNDERTYRQLLRLRSHGINKPDDPLQLPEQAVTGGTHNPWYYEMQELGYHYRITDIQCALALSQLAKLEKFLARRRQLVARYDDSFRDLANARPAQMAGRDRSGHHLYVLRIDFDAIGRSRGELMRELQARGIGSQVHYIPVPAHPHYQRLDFNPADYPESMAYYREALTIPLFYDLKDDEQEEVIKAVKELIG